MSDVVHDLAANFGTSRSRMHGLSIGRAIQKCSSSDGSESEGNLFGN
jgi:hypothetical protein